MLVDELSTLLNEHSNIRVFAEEFDKFEFGFLYFDFLIVVNIIAVRD